MVLAALCPDSSCRCHLVRQALQYSACTAAALWSASWPASSGTKLVLRHERAEESPSSGSSDASFFVYAAHEPLLGIVRTVAFQVVPFDRPYAMLLTYLLLPLALIALLVVVHRLLAGLMPKVAGNRDRREVKRSNCCQLSEYKELIFPDRRRQDAIFPNNHSRRPAPRSTTVEGSGAGVEASFFTSLRLKRGPSGRIGSLGRVH